jgi:hypothetical protein
VTFAPQIGFCRVCSFSGGYFCTECHVGQEWFIPARAIHNWDFRRFPVARRSAAFLEDIQHHPLLDLKSLNPRLYLAVDDMTQVQVINVSPSCFYLVIQGAASCTLYDSKNNISNFSMVCTLFFF